MKGINKTNTQEARGNEEELDLTVSECKERLAEIVDFILVY